MAELDDGPEQQPLDPELVEQTVTSLVGERFYDRVLTPGPRGEYTRHRRHEEAGAAVSVLWETGRIRAGELYLFAYDDGGGAHLPWPVADAHRVQPLDEETWEEKYRIITEVYGFPADSFEARTTPRTEAFWRFRSAAELRRWRQMEGLADEGPRSL